MKLKGLFFALLSFVILIGTTVMGNENISIFLNGIHIDNDLKIVDGTIFFNLDELSEFLEVPQDAKTELIDKIPFISTMSLKESLGIETYYDDTKKLICIGLYHVDINNNYKYELKGHGYENEFQVLFSYDNGITSSVISELEIANYDEFETSDIQRYLQKCLDIYVELVFAKDKRENRFKSSELKIEIPESSSEIDLDGIDTPNLSVLETKSEFYDTWITQRELSNKYNVYVLWRGSTIELINRKNNEKFIIENSPESHFENDKIYEYDGIKYQYVKTIVENNNKVNINQIVFDKKALQEKDII